LRIANRGLREACAADPGLAEAVNVHQGRVTNRAVAETFGLSWTPVDSILSA
jgi:alanine dehydrogenase